MQTPGGTVRPSRRCGKPKRFDESDSDDEHPKTNAARKQLIFPSKRKVSFIDIDAESINSNEAERPSKRQKIATPKVLAQKPVVFKGSITPTAAALVPAKPALVPAKQATVPAKQATVPAKQATVHAKQATVPAKLAPVPAKPATVPAKPATVPAKQSAKPLPPEPVAKAILPPTQLQRPKAGPKSVQEKWRAKASNNVSEPVTSVGTDTITPETGRGEDEEDDEDDLESMLSEYRQMFDKPSSVDMTKGNAIANGSVAADEEENMSSCRDCAHYRQELEHLEEVIKLKDCELQQILPSVNSSRAGGPKLAASITDNIEKRILYHKLFLEAEKKLRNTIATKEKWEALYNAEAGKTRDLELRCEALELKLKVEQKNASQKKTGIVEIQTAKLKGLTDIKNYHLKNCSLLNHTINMLKKENSANLKSVQKNENEYKTKFMRLKKHYQMLLEHYIQKESTHNKRKQVLEKKTAMYKDVGSRQQILRDSAKYLNTNQLVFLEGQLTEERMFFGKGNFMPTNYRELLLSLYQTSTSTYKVLKAYNFNIPPVLSIQQLSQAEVSAPFNEQQLAALDARSEPVPADRRTLRALCSDEEDEEIADLRDASAGAVAQQSAITDEEAEDGVDGDYGDDVQPEEGANEEEDEEGGADYLSDDELRYSEEQEGGEGKVADAGDDQLDQEFRTDLQLDNQLSNEFTAEPQFETMEEQLEHGVMADHHTTLVEQVETMDHHHHVVQEVTHVEQLVESMDHMQDHQIEHQIEISDINASNIVDAGAVGMVSVDASDEGVLNNVIVDAIGESNRESVDGVDHSSATTIVTTTTVNTTPVTSDSVIYSAETDVAERGPDMPLL